MPRLYRIAVLVPLAGAIASPVAAQARDSAVAVDSVFRWASASTPGCAVGVARGGRTILERAYGMANLEYDVPITPASIFEAGSVSKQFTAAAVALLALDGKLSLDDPISRYLPELPEYEAPVTIRQMLNHTSGFRDWGSVAAMGGWPRGTRAYTNAHALEIAARQRALNHPPGAEYIYSNTNYNLSAVLVERVSGMSFAEFTRTRLFEPVGMAHTSWRDDHSRIVKGRTTAYSPAGEGRFRQEMPFEHVHGNGGLLTTVADLLRWNEALTNRTVPGGARLVEMLETKGVLRSGRPIDYALGLFVTGYRGVPEVQHSGATAGYRAYLSRYPQQGLSVALLCNAASANPTALAHQVADVFLAGQLPAPRQAGAPQPATVRLPVEQLREKVGVYRHARAGTPMRVTLRDSVLVVGGVGVIRPLSRTTFVAADGSRGEFVADALGTVVRLQVIEGADTTTYEPVDATPPTAAGLTEYEGRYRSDEADAWYTLSVRDGKLFLYVGPGQEPQLTFAYRDAFTAPGLGLIRFRRGERGEVVGLSVGQARAREVEFGRR